MSEYQYYEFQAIDRPLTVEEMRVLRSYSTRATITPTRFTNHYEWGTFKGNPFGLAAFRAGRGGGRRDSGAASPAGARDAHGAAQGIR